MLSVAGRMALFATVFLTGAADVPSTVQAMKHGAIDFLEKPADEAELVRLMSIGAAKAREVAAQTVAEVYERVGFVRLGPPSGAARG